MEKRTVIKGSGAYLPERIIGNKDFLNHTFFDESGKVFQRKNIDIIQKFELITEIRERRYISNDLMNSDIATFAAERAIADSKIDQETLDYIIVAHNYGDISSKHCQVDIMPSIAARVKHKLGIKNKRCIPYDMIFGCPGWVQSMILIDQLGKGNALNNALVIGSDTLSRAVDPHDRNSMIFSDGAGAVVLRMEKNAEKGIISHYTISDTGEELSYLANGNSLNPLYEKSEVNISMRGRKVYEYVLKNVPSAIKKTIDHAGLTYKDISKFLIHQANAKMDHAILERLKDLYKVKSTDCRTMPMTIQTLGNSSVATIPTMYDLIRKGKLGEHKINEGDYLVFASVGAGMNVNALLYKA